MSIEGAIDLISEGRVIGWARDPDDPALRVQVSVVVNGAQVAEGTADRKRPDLRREGIGDGYYGFDIELPTHLSRLAEVELEVHCGNGAPLRAASQFRYVASPAGEWRGVLLRLRGGEPQPALPIAEGALDVMANGRLSGWARSPARPSQRLTVRLLVDGVVISEVRAELPRPDLEEAGLGDGRYGFELELPSLPASRLETMRLEVQAGDPPIALGPAAGFVQDADSESPWAYVLLGGRPVSETVVGRVDRVEDGRLCGWAWDPKQPAERLTIQALVNGRPVCRGTAGRGRSDLRRSGIGDGRYGFELELPVEVAQMDPAVIEALAGNAVGSLPVAAEFAQSAQPGTPWADAQLTVVSLADGCLAGVDDAVATGRAEPGADVQIMIDGEPVARGAATGGGADGTLSGSFAIPLPVGVAGAGVHLIRARAGHLHQVLPAAPWWQRDTGSRPCFQVQESEPQALVGEDGWLFLADDEDRTLDQALGRCVLPSADLDRWVRALRGWRRDLEALDIPYMFALAPIKERLCGSMLPLEVPHEVSRIADQMRLAIRSEPSVEMFDLLPVLADAGIDGLVFSRTDTSWTERGAFHAARALVKEAMKYRVGAPARRFGESRFVLGEIMRGNLLRLRKVTIEDGLLVPAKGPLRVDLTGERVERLAGDLLNARRAPAEQHLVESSRRPVRVYENPAHPDRSGAVLVGDQLGYRLAPQLAQYFGRCVFFHAPDPPLEAIELESPEIVFHVKDERYLMAGPGHRLVEAIG